MSMGWQMPPLSACIGLLLISIGIVITFDIRFKMDGETEDDRKK